MANRYAKVACVNESSSVSLPNVQISQDNAIQPEQRNPDAIENDMPVIEIPVEEASPLSHRWCCWTVKGVDRETVDRLNFIRKVYILLFLQLGITIGWIAVTTALESVNTIIASRPVAVFAPLGAMAVILAFMFCAPKGMHKVPYNYMLLLSFVLPT